LSGCRLGSDRLGSDRLGSDRLGSDRLRGKWLSWGSDGSRRRRSSRLRSVGVVRLRRGRRR